MPIHKPAIPAPRAPRKQKLATHHEIELSDPYAWLRDDDWEKAIDDLDLIAPPIRDHLMAENAYTEAVLAGTAPLRDRLHAEFRGRIANVDSTVPELDDGWAYYERFETDAEHPKLCRRPATGGAEQMMLDCDIAARGKQFWAMAEAIPSPDHTLLAYAFDATGSERCSLRIRDLAAGRNLPERITGVLGDLAWSADSRVLFYVRLDRLQRPMQLWRHAIGTHIADDVLVFEENDPQFEVAVGVTQSGRYILLESHAHEASEIWIIDAEQPASPPRCVCPRSTGHHYSVDQYADASGDHLVIVTNSAGAEDYRVCTVPVADLDIKRWREIVSHVQGRRIIDHVAYARHLVRLEREDGQPRIIVRRWSDGAEHDIAFAEEAYDLFLDEGLAFDTDTMRFVYSSMTTPEQTYDYQMETRARTLRKQQDIPSGHDPAHYITKRLQASAADGEQVPISLLYHTSTPLDGSAPLFMTAYGAYGDAMDAEFDPVRLSLVDRGFVFAIAHVRGGEDKGQRWYTGGKHRSKTNTFTDFITCAEHLLDAGYTRRGHIIAQGESAGGMLMGAVANMAPDLFLAIIADVPFVDVLNTMLDPTLPMTPSEWPEWGNPIENKQDFELIRSYCPYQNVKPQPYPHMLVNASLADLRVGYWEPTKWVARLRDHDTGGSLILLDVNMTAGHAGSSGRYQRVQDLSFDYAFALAVAGKDEVAPTG